MYSSLQNWSNFKKIRFSDVMLSIGWQKFPSRGGCQKDKCQINYSSWLKAQELSQSTTPSETMIILMFSQLGWKCFVGAGASYCSKKWSSRPWTSLSALAARGTWKIQTPPPGKYHWRFPSGLRVLWHTFNNWHPNNKKSGFQWGNYPINLHPLDT